MKISPKSPYKLLLNNISTFITTNTHHTLVPHIIDLENDITLCNFRPSFKIRDQFRRHMDGTILNVSLKSVFPYSLPYIELLISDE